MEDALLKTTETAQVSENRTLFNQTSLPGERLKAINATNSIIYLEQ